MKIKKTNAKLGEVIKMLRKLDCEEIFARQPWSADSECMLVDLEEGDKFPKEQVAAGFAYSLDVVTALEVLEAFGKRRPKMDESSACSVTTRNTTRTPTG